MQGSPEAGPSFRHEMPPRADAVTALVDGLEAFAEDAGLSPRATGRLVVVVEELAANVAMHAAGATFLVCRPRGTAATCAWSSKTTGPPSTRFPPRPRPRRGPRRSGGRWPRRPLRPHHGA
ncbi:hypothetical protein ACE7GA_14915 [Roseomonas sp. CCTCC AB2023176]|uniref:hypothetical protein n=1 Tax=Roseomonas sp. CCTCC AB2023176 TaxID=3342640 RepID=UPI0035D5F1DE